MLRYGCPEIKVPALNIHNEFCIGNCTWSNCSIGRRQIWDHTITLYYGLTTTRWWDISKCNRPITKLTLFSVIYTHGEKVPQLFLRAIVIWFTFVYIFIYIYVCIYIHIGKLQSRVIIRLCLLPTRVFHKWHICVVFLLYCSLCQTPAWPYL